MEEIYRGNFYKKPGQLVIMTGWVKYKSKNLFQNFIGMNFMFMKIQQTRQLMSQSRSNLESPYPNNKVTLSNTNTP